MIPLRTLLARIADRDPRARTAATATLADPAALPPLLRHLQDGEGDADIVVELLWHHAERPPLATWSQLLDRDAEADPAILRAIAVLDASAVTTRVVSGVATGDSAMIELAGAARLHAAEAALRACVDDRMATLRLRGNKLRMGPDAIDMELEALPRAIVALAALGHRDTLRHLPALAQLGSTDSQFAEPVRALAARGLCSYPVAGMQTALEGALKREHESEVAVALIDALTLLGTPAIVDLLLRRAAASTGIAEDRLVERLVDLIGGQPTDDVDELRRRWSSIRRTLRPDHGVRGGEPVRTSIIAMALRDPDRAPTVVADAMVVTGERFGALQPEIAARFLDLAPRVLAWDADHPVAPGTILKQGIPIEPNALT